MMLYQEWKNYQRLSLMNMSLMEEESRCDEIEDFQEDGQDDFVDEEKDTEINMVDDDRDKENQNNS
jgi:hypothetical protein